MMTDGNDPEAEFWKGGSSSQEDRFLLLADKSTRLVEQSRRDPGRSSPAGHAVDLHNNVTDHGLVESAARLSAVARGKRPARSTARLEGPENYQGSPSDSDSGDESMVKELLDSSDFEASDSVSESISSANSTTGKKRTVPYENTFGPSSEPVTPSKKQARLTRQSARATTETASSDASSGASAASSHSSGSAMHRLRLIEEALASLPNTPQHPGRIAQTNSPTPYRAKVASPTINRICDALDGSMGLGSTIPGIHIIAHSGDRQKVMDDMQLPWGVLYEIARAVSCGWLTWEQVHSVQLERLRNTSNVDGIALLSQIFPRPVASQSDMQLWAELDREELAICEKRGRGLGLPQQRGLGLQGEWETAEDWYGGKIQQVARLEEQQGTLRLVLSPMEMRKSTRFARFLGSRRILQISIPQSMRYAQADKLKEFLMNKFILCGRVFVAFGAKDSKVFLMETNEDYERGRRVPGDDQRLSLEEFIAWHNPMDKNGNQAVSKWATRFDLGLSVSVPVLSFNPKYMYNIDDEVVNKVIGKKAPTEEIYTDGCGFMNGAALSAIGQRMGFSGRPTAVQGRIEGTKGVWVLHPRDHDPHATPKIWTRDSQRKIVLDHSKLDAAHCIFDLVAPPRVILPSRLSRLTVMNLSHNGVPKDVFVQLMQETLEKQVRELTQWTRPQDMQLLWEKINRLGHVTASRIQQYALGASRALGLSGRIREDEFPSDEPADPITELLDVIGAEGLSDEEAATLLSEIESAGALPSRLRNEFTGEPLTIHGAVMDLLQAGFHPLRLPILYEKLKTITVKAIEDIVKEFHVSVPMSAEAFIVPDPYGVLGEGEIHFKSTKDLKSPLEDLNPNILLGEVLIYRNPVRVPSDVQKVIAVQHERLASYTDVIVLPTKGPCSMASKLAGGDYDGDVCVCIYDPRIVASFNNPPLTTPEKDFLRNNFEDQGKIEQVAAIASDMSRMDQDADARRKRLQAALLSDVAQPPIGAYSLFHENAAYAFGYDAPETVRNAFMFNTILDSRKSGLRVKDEIFRRDKRKYDRKRPECLPSGSSAASDWFSSGSVMLARAPNLGPFILEDLLEHGKAMSNDVLVRYDKLKEAVGLRDGRDSDLLGPYERASSLLEDEAFRDDLHRIRDHVLLHIDQWRKLASESKSPSTPARTPSRSTRRRTGPIGPAEKRKKWKDLARSFATGPELTPDSRLSRIADLDALKASWAYAEKSSQLFPWTVAFQTLCRIKAANHGSVAMTGQFADSMSIPSSGVRVFEQSRLGMY
ncbi:hypothetical protein PYCCODRAFT_1392370 [Trametes coccinea BRFM310]|uniref:RNA-dependent RNA polymerase n=1 Tax=Trametes coccinea (strain BRFM310) TaxID=1353009 RepID=A0A1Y2IKM3_TRAC3|nr:hypothetical protein PYCCODRAFT_1392370 [Trametes coccinea BRFM310]